MPASAAPAPRPRRRLVKVLAAGTSLLLALGGGEIVLRIAGGYRLGSALLQRTATAVADPAAPLAAADDLIAPFVARLGAGRGDLDPAWLRTSPPPLQRPPALEQPLLPQQDWLLHYYVLNEVLLRAMWVKGQGIPALPGLALPKSFATFAPPSGGPQPRYRYPASRTLPTRLVTNAFGFRGRELAAAKPARTVRIAFVGASTTVEAHGLPLSAPELIEHWLAQWAAAKRLDVRFETLNAAREAIQSADIRAIVQDEVLPLGADYVVYYEGANQLQPLTLQKHVQVDGSYALAAPPAGLVGNFDDAATAQTWFDRLAAHSALCERLRSLLRRAEPPVAEPEKPAQQLALPDGFGGDFPLARAGEVLECGAIANDLTAIRQAAAAKHARLVLCTFAWLAQDGMTTDPVLGRNTFIHLNRAYWPFRYATIRALADLQNRFFAAFARGNDLDLIDVAGELPMDARLYIDAIHHTELGVRLKAWVMFAALTRALERDLRSGALPTPAAPSGERPASLGTVKVLTTADLDAGK